MTAPARIQRRINNLDTTLLAPLAQVIGETLRATPVRLGTPDGMDDLTATLTLAVAAYMGRELGPDAGVLGEIQAERERQDTKFGEQDHRDGTSTANESWAEHARARCQEAADADALSWAAILYEEFTEALAEEDPAALRAELVQVAAVAVAWIGAIDRRTAARVGGDA